MSNKLNIKLYEACKNGNLQIVKKILESPTLSKDVDLSDNNFQILRDSIKTYNEEFIDYIINLKEIKESNKVKEEINQEFGDSCFRGKVKNLIFFNENEKYSNYIDLDFKSGWFFRTAFKNYRKEVVIYLIKDCGLKLNDKYVQITFKNENTNEKNNEMKIFSVDIFNKISLFDKLEQSLAEKELKKTIKKKI